MAHSSATPGSPGPATDETGGRVSIVGIGPGLPHAMTQRARERIRTADCVIASTLYQEFLRRDGTLPPERAALDVDSRPDADRRPAPEQSSPGDESAVDPSLPPHDDSWSAGTVLERPDGSYQTLVRSSMGRQVELAREAFSRVRAGQTVAHVSGGDPNVYGKSDLVFTMADAEDATDVPIEVVPGVTAALGAAASLGAPLSNDVCTISLSDKWRGWEEIAEKLRGAAIAGFVVVLYNCWRNYERAVDILREHRHDDVPVAIVNDAGRGDAGRNADGECHTITTLGEATDHDDEVGGMGTSLLVGTSETETWSNDFAEYLVTPRGGRDVEDF